MSKKNQKSTSDRFSTITEVTNPLKFFALALLIVEAIIAVLSARATDALLHTLAYLATFMFVLVVMMVVLIIAKWPAVLTATRPSQLPDRIQKKVKALEIREKQKGKILKEHGDISKMIREVTVTTEPIIVKQRRVGI